MDGRDEASGDLDELHLATRILLWTVVVLAFAAGVELFVLSASTDRFFAWTIQPPISAAFLGATYWSASLMAFLSVRTGKWSSARPMLVGILAVTPLLLAVTLLHIGKFHLGQVYGVAWIVVYTTLPVVTPLVLTVQRRHAHAPTRSAPFPPVLRALTALLGAALAIVGLVLLFAPSASRRFWPWPLATLSAQAIGSWLVAYAVTVAWLVHEGDTSRSRSAALAYPAFGLLGIVALIRYPSSVRWSSPRTLLLLASLVAAIVGGVGVSVLGRKHEGSRRAARD